MSNTNTTIVSLDSIAAGHLGKIHENLSTAALVEEVLRRGEGHVSNHGAVAVRQGQPAQRSLDATYVVAGAAVEADWLVGERYAELDVAQLSGLSERLLTYLRGRDVYVQDILVGGGQDAPLTCRVITETAWHALMTRTLYRPVGVADKGAPPLTVVHAPGFRAAHSTDGIRDGAFTVYDPERSVAYVGGSAYGGELRKAVMSLASLSASSGVLPLRGAVSLGADGSAALFLGRTGTGKTALALHAGRLLADHAVGWSGSGLTGFERGAYASVRGLDPQAEPAVARGTERVGSVLENVVLDPDSHLADFSDGRLTANLRAAIRLQTDSAEAQSCGHPAHIFLLTRDTAGVLPPIARLTSEQAVFAFLISYTSSLADTEAGQRDVRPDVEAALGDTPVAVAPAAYARRFLKRVLAHGATCWFVNTGWVAEPADRGERVDLGVTQTLIRAALLGDLDNVDMEPDPLFLFDVPRTCPGVDAALLNPRELAEDPAEFEIRANLVATAFIDAFAHFEGEMPAGVAEMVDSVVLFEETLDVMENFRLSF